MGDGRPVRSLGVAERRLEEALSLGPELTLRARRDGAVFVAASEVSGPAIVLGAAQRAGRVVDIEACSRAGTRVLRRSTTGTAAYVGGRAILWTLALPEVSALMSDASPRTLLNRNVRGFLRGFKSAGAVAHYFGREWIAVRRRPSALLGFDVAPSGEVLIEALAGYDASIAIPEALLTQAEREVDRWLGKAPAALIELIPLGRSPSDIAQRVVEAIAEQAGAELEGASFELTNAEPAGIAPVGPLDPFPGGLLLAPPRRIPIGWVEAAATPAGGDAPRRAWLGGDMLAPTWALAEIARASAAGEDLPFSPADIALEGATLEDLLLTVKSALDA